MAVAFVNATAPQTGVTTVALNTVASPVAGNLLLAFIRHSGSSCSAPAGWTMKAVTVGGVSVGYRWATGSEAASYTFTVAATQTISGARMVQLSGAIGSGDPFDAITDNRDQTNQLTSVALSVNTTVANAYLLYADEKNNTSRTVSSPPSGMTNRDAAAATFHIFDSTQAVAGASGSKQATYTVSSFHYDTLMAIKPIPAQTVTPSGVAETSAVGTPTLSLNVTPSGVASTSAVGNPAVSPGAVTVSPSGIASTSDVGTPTFQPGAVTVAPTGVSDTTALGTPTLAPGAVTITVDGLAPTSTVGDPTVDVADPIITPDGIDSTVALGTPTVTPGPVTVVPDGIASTAQLGVPTLTPGAIAVAPGAIAPTSAVGAPTVVPAAVMVAPSGIDVGPVVGSPRVNYNPRQHRATLTDRSRVTTVVEHGRTHAVADRSRTTTIKEAP